MRTGDSGGLQALFRGLLALLAPHTCMSCRRGLSFERPGMAGPPAALCARCRAELPWLAWRGRCRLCQCESSQGVLAAGAVDLCPPCQQSHSTLDVCRAALSFEGPAIRWIHRLKYPEKGLVGLDPAPRALLDEIAFELLGRSKIPRPDALVPVPLHPRRLRQRGFNPATLVARSLAARCGGTLEAAWLVRTRDTPSQTRLDRVQRRRNVRGAFACVARAAAAPHYVWLVDDVVTTGATLEEAALVLRSVGVRRVVALCAARTPAARSDAKRATRVAGPAGTG